MRDLKHSALAGLCRITLCVACLGTTFVTIGFGQAVADPLAEVETLMRQGLLDKALAALNPITLANPEPKGAEYLRGLILYEKGNMQDASTAFAKAVAQDPSDLEAMKMEGASLFRSGRSADAIPLLEKAQGSSQKMNVDPQYVLGLCYLDTRRFDDARHAFASQYDIPPNSAAAYLLEARMQLRRDFLPAADKSARTALELKPDLPMAHLLLGQLALAHSDITEAIAQFNAERNLNPMYGQVYDRLGDAYLRGGDYANAQKSLDRAILLEPTLNIPYILLGKVLLEQNDPLSATMYLKHAIDIDTKNSMAHALLGRAYRTLGRKDDAAVELRTAADLQQNEQPVSDLSK